ncbi:MAG: IclR family transcriptional regulator [Actinomycetota bacterium]|nr:MAG: IclR family transcriptional regulator [Actinomycetota bacterium]
MNQYQNGSDKDQTRGTLARGLRLMAVLASAERAVGLSELTALTGFSKPTVHRLARALVDLGYVEQSDPPSSRYSLRPRVLELGYTYLAGLQIRELARRAMRTLADQFGENVTLSVLDGSDVVYVERHEARPTGLVFKTSVGSRMPVYCSSLGKAILAWLPEPQRSAVIEGCRFERYTEFTIAGRLQLEEELKKVRQKGFAINDQEMEVGVRSVGAPIFGDRGVPIGALNISVPSVRLSRRILEEEIAPVLVKCALEISLSRPNLDLD